MSAKSLRKFAYDSMYRPGIDLAVIIAAASSILDTISLFNPWLVGITSSYVSGKGLTYTISLVLSGLDLIGERPFIAVVFVPIAITVALVFFSLQSEGLIPPKVSYKTKSRILLLAATLLSMAPGLMFVNQFTMGIQLAPRPGVFVGRWELGGGATMPTYAGFGFALALGLKMIKD